MTWEEDYLLKEVAKLRKRMDAVEAIVTTPKGKKAAKPPDVEPDEVPDQIDVSGPDVEPGTEFVDGMSEKDRLAEQAVSLGIDVDGRWGADRLRAEIAKVTGNDEE